MLKLLLYAVLVQTATHALAAPCAQPVTYKIGQVDARFNLTHDELAQHLRDAAQLWNTAAGKTLLTPHEQGVVSIHFVFDERQRNTQHKEQLTQTVAAQKQDLSYLNSKLSELKMRYEMRINDFKFARDAYNMRMSSYNNAVSYANNRGGADRYAYNDLSSRRMELERDASQLRYKQDELRDLERQLRRYADEYNHLARRTNQTVNQVNTGSSEPFEGGHYDSRKKSITIYQYQSPGDLKRILAHELGHALKIGHVQDPLALMYYLNKQGKLVLSADDIAALQRICRL